MSWRTNPFVLALRNAGRTIGLNRWVASRMQRGGYEVRYDAEFAKCLRMGDCVWDIGANVGHYARLFSQRVGPSGVVCAFEPSKKNFSRLMEGCSAIGNVKMFAVGIGSSDGKLAFLQGEDDLGATSRVSESGIGDDVVEIRSGDSLVSEGVVSVPHAIKIDVEGFEGEVLRGMRNLLSQGQLRAIGIEVHFRILRDRGGERVPQEIERLLKGCGFSITWPDSSHILALRNA
jgi:FkbM family methyltransferase